MPVAEVARDDIADLNADLYRPADAEAPGIVLALGSLREGRRYPPLERIARLIAGCGFAVLVPELGRLKDLVLGEDAMDDLVTAAQGLPAQEGVVAARVGLIGFSLGGSLALLAAGDDRLRERVACVAAVGAYFRLSDMLVAATAGLTGPDGSVAPLAGPSAFAVAASLIGLLPEPDRGTLRRHLDADAASPQLALSRVDRSSLGREARDVVALLQNRDPGEIASLVAKVGGLSEMMSRLSPERVIRSIDAPVWVLHDERDRYVPAGELGLIREAVAGRRNFRFFSIRLLEHTEPAAPVLNPFRLFGDYVPGLFDLLRFAAGPMAAVRRAAAEA